MEFDALYSYDIPGLPEGSSLNTEVPTGIENNPLTQSSSIEGPFNYKDGSVESAIYTAANQSDGVDSGGNFPYANDDEVSGKEGSGVIDGIKNLFKGANRDAAQTGRSVDQILKEYGLSDKVVSSLIQVGGGMLAGASSAKMAEKNRNETWARDDAVVAKERARREANYKAGKVSKLNYKPTGLLEAMKK